MITGKSADTDPKENLGFVGTVGKVMVLCGGFAYLSGFLVVLSFLGRYGIPPSADAFRLRYVYVGILYMLFPFFFGCPVAALIYRNVVIGRAGQATQLAENTEGMGATISRDLKLVRAYVQNLSSIWRLLDLPMILLTLNLILALCTLYGFASSEYLHGHIEQTLWLVFLSVLLTLGIALAQRFVEGQRKRMQVWMTALETAAEENSEDGLEDQKRKDVNKHNRWALKAFTYIRLFSGALLTAAVIAELYYFWGFVGKLLAIFFDANGYQYLLFIVMMGLVSWRAIRRYKERKHSGLRGVIVTSVAGLFGALYFFSVLTFSLWVYPFIPFQRGGGDYTDSKRAVVYFTQDSVGTLPCDIKNGAKSVPLVIIEETPQAIYVADPRKDGGPEHWRTEPSPNVDVIEIPWPDIVGIIRASPRKPGPGSQSHSFSDREFFAGRVPMDRDEQRR
jgi:hypothetical protein